MKYLKHELFFKQKLGTSSISTCLVVKSKITIFISYPLLSLNVTDTTIENAYSHAYVHAPNHSNFSADVQL